MKILIITGIFPPDIGGPATYVPQIAKGLIERGHSVTVLTLTDGPKRGSKELSTDTQSPIADSQYPFRVIRLPRQTFKPWRWLRTILSIIRLGKGMDVLYVNGLAMEAVLANYLLKKPMVQKVVGDLAWERATIKGWVKDNFEEFQKKHYGRRVELLKNMRAWWTCKADKVLVPSRYLARWVALWGIPEEKIIVIYNAVEPLNGLRPAELPLHSSVKLVTVGRLVSWKGVDGIIRAIAEVEGTGLVIVGDGPERNRLEILANDLKVANRVYFAGQRNAVGTSALMAACDLFVLNSNYEGFPHVMLEAMSLGLPVVATNVGGTPEAAQASQAAILITPGDTDALCTALKRVMDCQRIDREIMKGTQAITPKFSISNMVLDTERILTDVAKAL
ncbi:MAG: glycosyltransferase family 4 protein [Deltaproteobacteria bacterium]|nr:glycosyltransferase family 4 protein [Deltaproteobacteria bacterium]